MEENGNIQTFVADLNLNVIIGKPDDGRTIGYIENNSNIIHTYSYFINTLENPSLSAHFAHEWSHMLGFKHPIDTGTNQTYLSRTIPYAIGKIVQTYLESKFSDLMMICSASDQSVLN